MLLINGQFLTQPQTGIQRFAHELLHAARAGSILDPAQTRFVLPRRANYAETTFAQIPTQAIGNLSGWKWEQLELPRACGEDTRLVSLCNSGPIAIRQQLVVIHDAAIAANPKNYKFLYRMLCQTICRGVGWRSKIIGTVSRFSASELTRHFGIPSSKIEIIPESGEHILKHKPDYSLHEQMGLESGRYFFAVGSLAPNKNFSAILQALEHLRSHDYKFVVAGKRHAKIFQSSQLDSRKAIEVGYVSDAQLRALYERAACFIFPSIYEGFGLPPLEAMCCGCPVLVSNTSSMPEVCGDAAVYCNPADPRDLARQLSRILDNPSFRKELIERGLLRVKQWTWTQSAHRLGELIRLLAA